MFLLTVLSEFQLLTTSVRNIYFEMYFNTFTSITREKVFKNNLFKTFKQIFEYKCFQKMLNYLKNTFFTNHRLSRFLFFD